MRRNYHIWAEGYTVTGQSSGPNYLGCEVGDNFKDACDTLASGDSEFAYYYDPDRMTYWGCKLYEGGGFDG